jgi:hypothetical protein
MVDAEPNFEGMTYLYAQPTVESASMFYGTMVPTPGPQSYCGHAMATKQTATTDIVVQSLNSAAVVFLTDNQAILGLATDVKISKVGAVAHTARGYDDNGIAVTPRHLNRRALSP